MERSHPVRQADSMAMRLRGLKSFLVHFILIVVPFGLFCLALTLRYSRGPAYLSRNLEPEYAYLMNSLNITQFHAPRHTDHPGTTVQTIGAVVLVVQWFAHRLILESEGLVSSVLLHPESDLWVINIAFNLLIAACFIIVSFRIKTTTKSILLPLVFQLSFLLSLGLVEALTSVAPEPILILTGLLLSGMFVPIAFGYPKEEECHLFKLFSLGAVLAFGMVTKVTFLPLIAFVAVIRERRNRFVVLAATGVGLALLTLPIVTQYKRVASWLFSIAVHKGKYGEGEKGLPEFSVMANNLKGLISSEPALFVALLLYIISVVLLRKKSSLQNNRDRLQMTPAIERFLIIICIVIVLQILMVTKHQEAHYLLPAITVVPFGNLLVATLLYSLQKAALLAALGITIVLGIGFNTWQVMKWADEVVLFRDDVQQILTEIVRNPECQTIVYHRSSLPSYALSQGNDFSGKYYAHILNNQEPNSVVYNIWSSRFYTFKGEVAQEDIKKKLGEGKCILMYGRPLGSFDHTYLSNLIVEPYLIKQYEALYRLVGFK